MSVGVFKLREFTRGFSFLLSKFHKKEGGGRVFEWRNHVVMIVGVSRLSPLKFEQAASVKNSSRKTEKGPQQ